MRHMREDRADYDAAGSPYRFPVDAFIGRSGELQALHDVIAVAASRLITVVGPAGVGKSRLAMEAVRTAGGQYPGGATVVRLAAIERPGNIVPEIARALGLIDQAEKIDALVRETLAREPSVLVLDCFEHLTPAANDVIAGLLADCPPLRLVLTSRRPTALPGEVLLELRPLALAASDSTGAMLESDAVRLFIDRAQRARPWFTLHDGDAEIIHELCARYDGLPLAIELFASWMTVLSPQGLRRWQPDELEFRTPVADPRHQSLLDAIAWSYGLLTPDAQSLLARLSFFAGGFSRDLVEKMAQGREAGSGYPFADGYPIVWASSLHGASDPTLPPWDEYDPEISRALPALSTDPVKLLATLVDHRLVYQSGEIDGIPRFDMLEAIREFGLRQLDRSGELPAVQHAHAAAMIAFSEASAEGLWNPIQRQWNRGRIDAELQNLRLALAWAHDLGDAGAEIAARIAGPLWPYWQTRGMVTEGRRYLEDSLFRPGLKVWCRGKELPALAFLCWIQGDDERCQEVVAEGLIATEQTGIGNNRAMIYLVMALLEFRKGPENVLTMLQYTEEAEELFRYWEDPIGLGACNLIFGQVCRLTGETARALELFDEAFAMHQERGYEWGMAAARYFAAEALRDLAETDPARIAETVALLNDALGRFWAMGDFWGTGGAMSGLACVLAMQEHDVRAASYFGAASVLMGRVSGSLLPSELMTHKDTETELRARMPEAVWDAAFALGQNDPEQFVQQALAEAAVADALPIPALTRIQRPIVQDMVQGYDIPRIAQRRHRSVSATYEIANRILKKYGLTTHEEIAPFAVKHGLVDPRHR